MFLNFVFLQNTDFYINKINVYGSSRLNEKDVKRIARIYDGMTMNMDIIKRAIDRIWDINQYSHISFNISENNYSEKALNIILKELYTINSIEILGNKKVSKKKIEELITFQKNQIISEMEIFNVSILIKQLYYEKGYHFVDVSYNVELDELNMKQDVNIIISEGKKVRIKEINIVGSEKLSNNQIKRKLKNTKQFKWYFPWRGNWEETKFKEDLDNLSDYYFNSGFKDFYVQGYNLLPNDDSTHIVLNLNIYEGLEYYYSSFSWTGNNLYDSSKLQNIFGLKVGDKYEKDKFDYAIYEKITPLYMNKGYFYFQIIPELIPNNKDSINVIFNIVENDKVYIRNIDIFGNHKTHEDVVRRAIRLYPGQVYNQAKLRDSYRDVFYLNYFENVVPNVNPISENEIDISFEVIEKSTGQANLQMGYNGEIGFTGGGGIQFPNFRGKGQNLSFNYQRGVGNYNQSGSNNPINNYSLGSNYDASSYQSISFQFIEPWLLGTPNLTGVSYSYSERGASPVLGSKFDHYQHSASIRLGRKFEWPDRFFSGSWSFGISKDQWFHVSKDTLSNYFNLLSNELEFSNDRYFYGPSGRSITQRINRNSTDFPEFATRGSKFEWISILSGYFLKGEKEYIKNSANLELYYPLYKDIFVFFQNVKFGLLQFPDAGVLPPYYARFRLGGSGMSYGGEMLRGYSDNSIGPSIGGNILLKITAEARISLSKNPTIYCLAFTDIGDAWYNFEEVNLYGLKTSVGVGVRFFMPMLGMLGYDIGYGFNNVVRDNNGPGWEYHFILGMPF